MPALLFVTDPLCSWCWGTLPQILQARKSLPLADLDFDLIMGGLQVGSPEGIAEFHRRQLRKLWKEVRQVTGQPFSEVIPPDFVYHSEIACRGVEIARHQTGEPPWDFFTRMQHAFYVDGLNVNRPDVIAGLLDATEAEVRTWLYDPQYIQAARANFRLAETLSANALPCVMLDVGEGYRLLTGGYVTAEYLVPEIQRRLADRPG